jgi:hypothetical protein
MGVRKTTGLGTSRGSRKIADASAASTGQSKEGFSYTRYGRGRYARVWPSEILHVIRAKTLKSLRVQNDESTTVMAPIA